MSLVVFAAAFVVVSVVTAVAVEIAVLREALVVGKCAVTVAAAAAAVMHRCGE